MGYAGANAWQAAGSSLSDFGRAIVQMSTNRKARQEEKRRFNESHAMAEARHALNESRFDESVRQFNESMAQDDEHFDRRFGLDKRVADQNYELGMARNDVSEMRAEDIGDYYDAQADLGRDRFEWGRIQDRRDDYIEDEQRAAARMLAAYGGGPGAGSGDDMMGYANEQILQGALDDQNTWEPGLQNVEPESLRARRDSVLDALGLGRPDAIPATGRSATERHARPIRGSGGEEPEPSATGSIPAGFIEQAKARGYTDEDIPELWKQYQERQGG